MTQPHAAPVLVRALLEAVNAHAASRVARLHSVDFEGLDAGCSLALKGRTAMHARMEAWLTAFPDLQVQGRTVWTTAERALIYWTLRGTHHGPFLRIPPTGRPVGVCGCALLDLEAGAIRRGLYLWDLAGLLRALHLLPELPHAEDALPPDRLLNAFLQGAMPGPSPARPSAHPSH